MEKTVSRLSRRNVLVGLGGALAVGAVLAAPYKTIVTGRARALIRRLPGATRLLSLANAGYDEWRDQVGTVFNVSGATMRLIGVEALNSAGTRPPGLRDRAFAAHFTVLNGRAVAGDLIYLASQPDYGPFSLFLSGSGDPAMPSRMLAVFN
jgi:hypothetical protein